MTDDPPLLYNLVGWHPMPGRTTTASAFHHTMDERLTIIGGGLAGAEAAFQAAQGRGVEQNLHLMRTFRIARASTVRRPQ